MSNAPVPVPDTQDQARISGQGAASGYARNGAGFMPVQPPRVQIEP
jgi:hypothetical protein